MTNYRQLAYISVKSDQFNALGNGSNNDTTAIQNAVNFASNLASQGSASGAVLYFPPGEYMINNWIDNPGNVSMVGAGARASKISALAGFPATKTESPNGTYDAPMVIVRKPTETSIEVSDLYFDGKGIAPSGLHLVQTINICVRNIRTINHLKDGIVVDGVQNSSFMNCRPSDSQRYNWHFMNGAKLIELVGCNGRDGGVANVGVKVQSTFPGAGVTGGDERVRCVNWFGHIFEGNVYGTKQYVIDLDQARRWSFKGMNIVGSPSPTSIQAAVRMSANAQGRFLFESCFFNSGGGPAGHRAVVVEGGGKAWVRDTWFENYTTTNLMECSVIDGLFVDRCHFAGSLTLSGKLIANTSGTVADTRVCAYEDWRSSGTTADRPNMSDIDAVTQYWDRTLGKPIWWDPNANVWKDAAGATV